MTSKQTRNKTKIQTAKTAAKKSLPSRNAAKASVRKSASKSDKPAKPSAVQENPTEIKKSSNFNTLEENPRLLRDTKSTAAALNMLEKAIKLIYHKDFKKARAELKLLIETHPGESEIRVRAGSYLQICDREEGTHKKAAVGNDQLYTLGVMEHNRGNFDKAIGLFRQSLEKNPKSDHIYYSLAASHAAKNEIAEAISHLEKAIELNEENRVYAKNDSDFSPLHDKKEFAELVGWNQPSAE
jgi:tetratricopeptide (TPR) repeat protein